MPLQLKFTHSAGIRALKDCHYFNLVEMLLFLACVLVSLALSTYLNCAHL
jgi:hypothetical protein